MILPRKAINLTDLPRDADQQTQQVFLGEVRVLGIVHLHRYLDRLNLLQSLHSLRPTFARQRAAKKL